MQTKKVRKFLSAVLIAATVFAATVSVNVPAEAATKITLSTKTLSIKEGEYGKISLKSKNVDSVTWKSDNTSIASVSNEYYGGYVYGVNDGTTTVRAICTLYNGKKKTVKCTVIVKDGRYLKNPKPYQINGDGYSTNGLLNMYGTQYKNCVCVGRSNHKVIADQRPSYGDYKLDGKYKTFTYTIGHVDGWDKEGKIRIYLDGELVKDYDYRYKDSESSLSINMIPRTESIDVTGVQQMRISFPSTNGYQAGLMSYALADLVLDKGE